MKPRFFIGSSTEALEIANAIQTNLQYEAESTIWTQGIFQLSSNSLDDLLLSLSKFDFGIFVFTPDDIINMRNNQFSVVRDNVVFEMGMFFGKLGKDRVFFVVPEDTKSFHLPSDLLGILAGKYDNKRSDKNLHAALGPFCDQIRGRIKKFIYESLEDLVNENPEIKDIAFEKKPFWEQQLTAALLKSQMKKVQDLLEEIKKEHVFKKAQNYTVKQFINWFRIAFSDLARILKIAKEIYFNEMELSWGPPGEPGKVHEIKKVVDKIGLVCSDLLVWETDLQTIVAPDELQEIPKLMKGWSSIIIDEFAKLATILKNSFVQENIGRSEPLVIEIVFNEPPNVERINKIINDVASKIINGDLNYD